MPDAPEQPSSSAQPSPIHNSLLVFSGKGGVGKTTVAVNLALGLALEGKRVGLLDVDIHGPNAAHMLGADGLAVTVTNGRLVPPTGAGGVKVMSMAYLLPDTDAPVVWRGPVKGNAIRQFIREIDWGELDWLVVDSPPGTGDEPLSVAQLLPGTYGIIVTTPQAVALMDARKAVAFARLLKVRLLGIIENMSGLVCPHCGKEIELFPVGAAEKLARELLVPFLGRIPLDPRMVTGGDTGRPILSEDDKSEPARAFRAVVGRILAAADKPGVA
ncbi:MAG TPA: Mrp/NBP35 family ATP-binding protein [bacterium]|nr:Mrp/NBP35 family ATP-binding protein [bacterium]